MSRATAEWRARRCGAASNALHQSMRALGRALTRERGDAASARERERAPEGPPGVGWTRLRARLLGRDGIQLWTRRAPVWSGARENIKEVYAECEFQGVSRERFWNAVCDLSRYDEFVPFVAESRILRREGDKTWCHARVSTPVVKDRVYTIVITENHDKSDKNVRAATWVTTKEFEPPTPRGLAKMRANCGSWHVSDLERGGGIRVRYSLISDPGDGVPAWLLQKMNRKTVPDVLRAFRDRALSGKSEPVRAKPPPLHLVSNAKHALANVMENVRAFSMDVRNSLENSKDFPATTFLRRSLQQHSPRVKLWQCYHGYRLSSVRPKPRSNKNK